MPRVNYNAILKKLKEVSTIDTQEISLLKRVISDCTACSSDPFIGSDSFCEVCQGTGKITSDVTKTIKTSVDYISGTENTIGLNNTLQKGDLLITSHIDQITGAGYDINDFLNQPYPIDYVVVDNKKYEIISVTPGKLNGVIFEIEMLARLPNIPQSNL